MKLHRRLHILAAATAISFLLIAATHAPQSRNRNYLDPTSTYINTKGPVTQCNDLDVSFRGAHGSHAEETLTVPHASTPVLRAHVGGGFGIAVSAGSGPDYSVVVCKY